MATKNQIISEHELEITDDGLVFDPFNPKNKEITLNDVQCILKTYGLPPKINNLNLYKRAFVHTSYVKKPMTENINNNITIVPKPDNCLPLKTKSNERLEFLGDGILEADVVQPVPTLPTPIMPSYKEIEEHRIAHWPPRLWSDECREGFGRERPRLKKPEGQPRSVILSFYDMFLTMVSSAKPTQTSRPEESRHWSCMISR